MTVGSILLAVALLVLAGLYVARPLLESRYQRRRRRRTSIRQALLLEKEAILTQLRQLDFDFETGKLPEEDYQRTRAAYMSEAVTVLRQLDELGGGSTVESVEEAVDLDSDIEAAIARRRQHLAAPVTSATPSNGTSEAKFCPDCGQPLHPGDKFCSHCGHKLATPQPA
ncbi:MAG: zinc ribbon domain-containing protein [Candidatus Promineifilaceae bacterium]|nr:zinc ribbon domain-containing protein [Candidatus Promineifilaceae bacterium]